jgi:hypothetical protein
MTRRSTTAGLLFVAVMAGAFVWISATNAKDEASVLVKKPADATADAPTLPPPEKPSALPMPPQSAPMPRLQGPVVTPPQSTDLFSPNAGAAGTTNSVKRPFMQPAPPRGQSAALPQDGSQTMPMPAPQGAPIAAAPPSGPAVRAASHIEYETHHKARKMYRSGQVQLSLVTQDPSDGCCYEIPLCVPACCTGSPTVSGGRGLLGRGVVEYTWSCGFQAKVKFRHILGDVKVEYEVD